MQSKHYMYLSPWAILVCKAFTTNAKKLFYKEGLKRVILTFTNGRITWYGDKKRFHETVRENTHFLTKNPKYMTKVKKRFLKETEKIQKFIKKIKKINPSKLSNSQLWQVYFDYVKLYGTAFLWGEPLPFIVKETLSEHIKKHLKTKYKLNNKTANEFTSILVSPNEMSFVTREKYDLLKIACKISKNEKLKAKFMKNKLSKTHKIYSDIEKHTKAYEWIPYDYGITTLKQSHFIKELKQSLKNNPCKDLTELRNDFKELRKKQDSLKKKLKLNQQIIDIAEAVKAGSFLMDYKKEIFTKSHLAVKPLLIEIGKRLKLNLKLMQFLTISETKSGLLFDNLFTKKEMQKRHDFSVFSFENNKIDAFVDKEAKKFFKKELKTDKKIKTNQVKGFPASRGKVTGKVKIILETKELSKLKKGEILVAIMTSPDYTTTMKKAGAIITNEGGLTSHAAIVSRELKIPCIVGTKVATKVFKDDDLVEVDAEKGIIKKIK